MTKARYLGEPSPSGEREIDLGWRGQPSQERFLKGPIALKILEQAACLPGRTLDLWILIKHRTDLRQTQWVTLPKDVLAKWKIGRKAKSDGLRRLANAGMIELEHAAGHGVRVRLVVEKTPRKQRRR
jgi:hypothetical protein